MRPIAEASNPYTTVDSAFEPAYWRSGPNLASEWQIRQGNPSTTAWILQGDQRPDTSVCPKKFPMFFWGFSSMWTDTGIDRDHLAFLGLYGWLAYDQSLSMAIVQNTVVRFCGRCNLTYSNG